MGKDLNNERTTVKGKIVSNIPGLLMPYEISLSKLSKSGLVIR